MTNDLNIHMTNFLLLLKKPTPKVDLAKEFSESENL
jgi:hypothetical protein